MDRYRDLRKSMPALAAQEGKELEKRYQYAAESLKAGILVRRVIRSPACADKARGKQTRFWSITGWIDHCSSWIKSSTMARRMKRSANPMQGE